MQKVAHCPFLKNAEAAEALGVSVRTVKGWMRDPAKREAISAVRHGKQWRIPRPVNKDQWRYAAERRLREIGVTLPRRFERELRKRAREYASFSLESARLWIAACSTVLAVSERRRITTADRAAIDLLWQVAGEILTPLPRYERQVDKLKSEFPPRLLKRHWSGVLAALRYCSPNHTVVRFQIFRALYDVRQVMRYWPKRKVFEGLRATRTWAELEGVRKQMDYLQAVRELEYRGQKATQENIRPLLHKDLMAHLNDTMEQLPGIVVKNPTPEQMRLINWPSRRVKHPRVILDFRKPQKGLARRTAQKRYPRTQQPQCEIRAAVFGIEATVPGFDEEQAQVKQNCPKPALGSHSSEERDD